MEKLGDKIRRNRDFLKCSFYSLHRSLARVGYATQPSLGDDSVNIIIFTYISMGFVKLKIKVSPGLNFSC